MPPDLCHAIDHHEDALCQMSCEQRRNCRNAKRNHAQTNRWSTYHATSAKVRDGRLVSNCLEVESLAMACMVNWWHWGHTCAPPIIAHREKHSNPCELTNILLTRMCELAVDSYTQSTAKRPCVVGEVPADNWGATQILGQKVLQSRPVSHEA